MIVYTNSISRALSVLKTIAVTHIGNHNQGDLDTIVCLEMLTGLRQQKYPFLALCRRITPTINMMINATATTDIESEKDKSCSIKMLLNQLA